MKFLTDLLSSSDNDYPAIGRVLGVIVFAAFVLVFPSIIIGVLFCQKVQPDVWFELMDKIPGYVLIVLSAATGLIAGTAFTEKPKGTVQTSSVAVVTETKS